MQERLVELNVACAVEELLNGIIVTEISCCHISKLHQAIRPSEDTVTHFRWFQSEFGGLAYQQERRPMMQVDLKVHDNNRSE